MASYTGAAWIGAGVNSTSGTPYSTGWTVPSNIRNSCTFCLNVRATQTSSGNVNGGYLIGSSASDFYICNSSGGNAIWVANLGGGTITSNSSVVTINPRGLAGQVLYIKESGGEHMRGDCAFTITYSTANAVSAGNPIRASDRTQIGVGTTVGAAISDSHFSAGTPADASTFNSQVLGLT